MNEITIVWLGHVLRRTCAGKALLRSEQRPKDQAIHLTMIMSNEIQKNKNSLISTPEFAEKNGPLGPDVIVF